jgi:integrase
MATIRKPSYTMPIPAGAKITTARRKITDTKTGQQYEIRERVARFRHKGKLITAVLTADGARVRVQSDYWYVRYKDIDGKWKEEKAFTDKQKSKSKADEIQDRVDEGLQGVGGHDEHHQKPLEDHIKAWEAALRNEGLSAGEAKRFAGRVRKVAAGCGAVRIISLRQFEVESYLGSRRNDPEAPMSAQTHKFYVQALKRFTRWLVKAGRSDRDRLAELETPAVGDDQRTHNRRALTADEFQRLVQAAEGGPTLQGISGPDRAMLYILAAWTGYRRGELASVTVRLLELDGPSPAIRVPARDTKNGKPAIIPLGLPLVERLHTWLDSKGEIDPAAPLFNLKTDGGHWRKTAKLMRADLKTAREAWIKEAKGDRERRQREADDFLTYCDEDGAFADFHANRHTFITNLGRAGVPLIMAQKLARHGDPKLTTKIYTHLELHDLTAAVACLPPPPQKKAEAEGEILQATGTDGQGTGGERQGGGEIGDGGNSLPSAYQESVSAMHGHAQANALLGGEHPRHIGPGDAAEELPEVVKLERLGTPMHTKPR